MGLSLGREYEAFRCGIGTGIRMRGSKRSALELLSRLDIIARFHYHCIITVLFHLLYSQGNRTHNCQACCLIFIFSIKMSLHQEW